MLMLTSVGGRVRGLAKRARDSLIQDKGDVGLNLRRYPTYLTERERAGSYHHSATGKSNTMVSTMTPARSITHVSIGLGIDGSDCGSRLGCKRHTGNDNIDRNLLFTPFLRRSKLHASFNCRWTSDIDAILSGRKVGPASECGPGTLSSEILAPDRGVCLECSVYVWLQEGALNEGST
eukprot:2808088-Rhodomonas_salina.1